VRQFKDSEGKAWDLRVTAGTMVRVSGVLAINLGELTEGDPPLIIRLYTDPAFVAKLLAVILGPQIEKAKLSTEEFYDRLDPEVAGEARDGLVEELRDFFQKFGPVAIAVSLGKMREMVAEEDRRRTAAVEALTAAAILGTEENGPPGDSAANSQQSPASDPSPTPSES